MFCSSLSYKSKKDVGKSWRGAPVRLPVRERTVDIVDTGGEGYEDELEEENEGEAEEAFILRDAEKANPAGDDAGPAEGYPEGESSPAPRKG